MPAAPQRIVSLLPSTTEILFAVEAGDRVAGVTFECDYPAAARECRVVSDTTLPTGLDPAGIDAWVRQSLERGEDLYRLDRDALADIDPDLVVTQDLCRVCAVDVASVADALVYLGCAAEVVTVDPKTLQDVLASIVTIGTAAGCADQAEQLVRNLRARMVQVVYRVTLRPTRPRVLLLEWTDPPFVAGHWIPEMIELAGGEPVLATPGERSLRIDWAALAHTDPDLVVVAPCGFGREAAQEQADRLLAQGVLPPGVATYAVDANASWTRPGPRLVDGIEELADLLHPPRRRD